MTESIKQEIINNIFENGDKLITGPILQTVLIDMIDDVNVKDQAILSKTGSWDDAVTQIPNLATKEEVTNLSESVARDLENVVDVDLTGYATEQWVQNQGYLKEHQDISGLATKSELTEAENNLQGNITSLSESVARDLANVDVDLTGYATEQWVESKGYLTEHQDISNLATKAELTSVSESVQTDISGLATKVELNDTKNNLQGNITSLSESVARDIANVSVPEGVATEAWVQSQDYASKSYVDNAVSSSSVDLTGYATETWVQNQGYLKEHQDISNLATKGELNSVSESIQTDISNLATKGELNDTKNTLQGNITNLSESVANSAVWKKGTGTDSVVQAIADGTNLPTATGKRAIATGLRTVAGGNYSHAEGSGSNASGQSSHAEGNGSIASGMNSHAEGYRTEASGIASHAEGRSTIASNQYEHAQGIYNLTSSNQIFSVGAGEMAPDYSVNRRNAISILAVPNADTKINTASVFIQNIGGYDGTNPTPGTNDLATVINNLPSGGGSSETLWKKGTGQDSVVQVLTEDRYNPRASGLGAVAIGDYSHAEGNYSHAEGEGSHAGEAYSHAEGYSVNTNGQYSHAEGYLTTAAGKASHAEGYNTSASNAYEHAQGINNHSSANQIFSVGAGDSIKDPNTQVVTETRRNAISVLSVPNSETQINTASFFVQNVGGYDGTNPEPGTNDLATVINNLPSGGGSGNYLPLTGGTLTGDLRVNSSMGVGTGPQGTYCLAVGNSTTNTGGSHYALAVGENCQVKGAYGGVSLGRENVVNAAFGLATGFRCRTTYMAGYAGGCRSTASANFAFAAGFGAEATRVGQVVLGAYNELDPSGNNDSTGSYAVILANGKSSTWHQDRPGSITRSNGLAIKWDGGIDIKYQGSTITLQDKLNEIESKISSGGTATSTETWTFTLGDGTTVTKNILMA